MVRFPDIHTHHPRSTWALVNGRWPEIPDAPACSLGCHPWDATTGFDVAAFAQEAEKPQVWAIGEVGLDAATGPDMALQEAVFKQQIAVSEALQKPILLHIVRTFHHVLRIKGEIRPTQPWIVHGFSKNEALARQLLDAGMYLSFGLGLLGSRTLPRVLEVVPTDRLFLETDDAEGSIEELYAYAAQIKGTDPLALSDQITTNIQNTFRREPRLA